MAFPQPYHLTLDALRELLARFPPGQPIAVDRIRYKNRVELRQTSMLEPSAFRALILESLEEGELPGGDLECLLPGGQQRLVGHHDGVFWLENVST